MIILRGNLRSLSNLKENLFRWKSLIKRINISEKITNQRIRASTKLKVAILKIYRIRLENTLNLIGSTKLNLSKILSEKMLLIKPFLQNSLHTFKLFLSLAIKR